MICCKNIEDISFFNVKTSLEIIQQRKKRKERRFGDYWYFVIFNLGSILSLVCYGAHGIMPN